MTPGRLIVMMNIACFLVLPMVGNLVLGHSPLSVYYYKMPQAPAILVFVGLFVLCFTPLFGVLSWNSRRGGDGHKFCVATYTFLRRYILWLSIVLLVVIVLTFSPDWANYRYRATGISTFGMDLFIVLGLKAVIAALLLWLLSEYLRHGEKLGLRERLSVLVLSVSIFYTASGSADIFMVSIYFVLFLSPKWFVHFSTIRSSQNLLTPRTLYKNLASIVILILLMMSFRIGEHIKHGEGSAGEVVYMAAANELESLGIRLPRSTTLQQKAPTETSAPPNEVSASGQWWLARLLERMSTHYYSALQFFDGHAAKRLEQFAAPISYPIDSLGYRLRVLFKRPHTERPDITSLSLLNFRVLSNVEVDREGTSPGVLASFAYLTPLPIAVALTVFYFMLVAATINAMFYSKNVKFSAIGGLIVLWQLLILFQSPVDFIILVDNGFVFLVSFLVLAYITARASGDITDTLA